MPADVCAVVLAAGLGVRLRPLTSLVPKALVPVGNVPLLDQALGRLADAGLAGPDLVAVNTHWLGDQVAAHVGDRAHLSPEEQPLGTAGALGNLRDWIDGRPVLVLNADAYVTAPRGDLTRLLDGWDGDTVRLLGVPPRGRSGEFGAFDFAGASLLPGKDVAVLGSEPAELVKVMWRPAERAGRLSVLELSGTYFDCGTPASYLTANLHALRAAGIQDYLVGDDAVVTGTVREGVLGAGAQVHGVVRRSVLWPGAYVGPDEVVTDAVRVGRDITVSAV
jgi:NDP-sugar pyrophosphorylase family protein